MEWTRGHILGRGSSAAVSIATSVSGDVFAVKSSELSRSEFLQREQKFLSILSSPYLVSYRGYDITREDNKLMYNLFMEYVSGGTIIDAARDQGGVIKELMIAHYTRQIVQGLEYLHSSGVVHCDVKGRNILIGESGAKLADLGCAKWANQASPLGGTPMFMAPEVARGEEQGFPADIWALGCTVIEMSTGGSPWPNNVNGNDPMSILYQIAYSGELPEVPNFLSDQAKDFVSKCLRIDKTERWTAKELLNHPYLEESNSVGKQNEDFITSSPTSILDQDIWNSMESHQGSDQLQSCSSNSHTERIERLSCKSREANWRWEETWITIRGDQNSEGEGEGEGEGGCGPVTGWVGDEVEVDFNVSLDNNVRCSSSSSSSNNHNISMSCRGCSCSNNILIGCTCVQNNVGLGSLLNLGTHKFVTVA